MTSGECTAAFGSLSTPIRPPTPYSPLPEVESTCTVQSLPPSMVSTSYLREFELNLPTLVTTWSRRCGQANAECPHDRRAKRAERGLGHIHRPSSVALTPSLCKPEKHGKHTPGRRKSRRATLAAREVRGHQLDDLMKKDRGHAHVAEKRPSRDALLEKAPKSRE